MEFVFCLCRQVRRQYFGRRFQIEMFRLLEASANIPSGYLLRGGMGRVGPIRGCGVKG
jgi:hypothetical protein